MSEQTTPGRDPRLEIPEELRTPVPRPSYDPVYGSRESRSGPSDLTGMGKAWGLAADFIVTILAGAFLGWLADKWRGTLPLWTMVGLGIGFVGAFIRIVRHSQRQDRLETEARARRQSRADGPARKIPGP